MRRFHAGLLMMVMLLVCGCARQPVPPPTPPRETPREAVPAPQPSGSGFALVLSEGVEGSEKVSRPPAAKAKPLTDAQVQAVLRRMPALKVLFTDQKEFVLRESSLPPPRTGETVKQAFPPPEKPPAPPPQAAGPLEVLRHAPEGKIPLAPHLSVTFSQPMVAVTSVEEAAQTVPVKLTPQPPGKWRWVGAKTLLFEPTVRFPMATTYVVEVPAGTKSATGGTLEKAVRWTFTTPPPTLQSSLPNGGPQPLDPVMFAAFDQAVDPDAVLKTVRVTAAGRDRAIRMATAAEVATLQKTEGRWVAFKAEEPLPGDQSIEVSIGPGTPSKEGPNPTEAAQKFSFRTYGPLKIVDHSGDSVPGSSWTIRFSNPLDAKKFDRSMVAVEPDLPGMKVSAQSDYLVVGGRSRGRTTYRVTVDGSLADDFGQTLGSRQSVSFKVGSAPPSLSAGGGPLVVADPSGKPTYSVFSVNHPRLKVRMWAVGPEDWPAFANYMQHYRDEKPPAPPGHQALDTEVSVKAEPDEMAETRIDLAPALHDGFGHVVVHVEQTEPVKNRWERQEAIAWVEATHIGLDAFVDHHDLIGWATSLQDGSPLDGVHLTIAPGGPSGTSGKDGIARIALPPSSAGRNLLIARQGDDVAILPEDLSFWNTSGGWHQVPLADTLMWYVFDDRQMYRPGEEVHLKGWLRRRGAGQQGDVMGLHGDPSSVRYVLSDSRGNQVAKGDVPVNLLGGFDFKLTLPKTMNLGNAAVAFTATGGSGYHSFQVQEFRRPEFEVAAHASEGPFFAGGHADVSVSASYYAGGGLPNAEVTWQVSSSPGSFHPPGHDDFTFGVWTPWWEAGPMVEEESEFGPRVTLSAPAQTFRSHTDSAGKHRLRVDFKGSQLVHPMNISAEASVMDTNRQAWNASASLLVHPSDRYVGLRSDRTFVQQGEPLKVDCIVTDLDGKAVAGRPVVLRAARLDWTEQNGRYREVEVDPQEVKLTSGSDPGHGEFKTTEGGTYRIRATVGDAKGRQNQSELTLWVAGGKTQPSRGVEQQKVTLIPSKQTYQPGDTAEILLQAPFAPAEGILTLRRSGIVSTERFTMSGTSHTIKVPVVEGYIPNLYVQVDLVGSAPRADDAGKIDEKLAKRPAYATGSLNLSIPPRDRTLSLTVKPRVKALEPGAKTSVQVELKDAAGKPVAGGEVAVVVVDEAVLSLTHYRIPDPLGTFYAGREPGTRDYHSRAQVELAKPQERNADELENTRGGSLADGNLSPTSGVQFDMRGAAAPAPRAKAAMAREEKEATGEPQPQIQMRTNFNALAAFKASVPTDAHGVAVIDIKLPDNLTRYRIMAVAVAGEKQFGQGESTITARLPLMVRPSAPRFLNFGDEFELPVVLQNQTDEPLQVQVALRTANVKLTQGGGRAVTIPANDRVEVRFPAAAQNAGTARFQVGAVSGKRSDAAELSLPVWTPATTEAFATYGQIDTGATLQPVKAPADVYPQFGGLEVTTSSTALQALTDAVLYLQAYPFECSEQLSSRVMAVAALRDVLTAFKAEGLPRPEAMVAAVQRDIERLRGMQDDDGGFGFWQRGDTEYPYLGVHVAHALQRASLKGFKVPAEMLSRSQGYLRDIEHHIPDWYSIESRRAIVSYALYVRHLMGEKVAEQSRRLIQEAGLEHLSMESIGWLLETLAGSDTSDIRRYLDNHAEETAGAAHFTTAYSDGAQVLMASDRRADAVVLEALIADQPKNDLIPKIVQGLLAHRVRGRWGNTEENCFVLLALDRYFNTYEKVAPDFVARVWLGDRFAGDHKFHGHTTERHQIDVPMQYLSVMKGTPDLTVAKDGPGRLYYRIGMQYAPRNLKLKPFDAGFTLERRYEGVDEAKDVTRDKDGTWRIKAGTRVRSVVTMVAPSRRYHVALVDPLPAGLEAMNPALAVTGTVPLDPKVSRSPWWWYGGAWYEHQNLRDERAEAFTALLWEGVYTYSYVARATTPGHFVVPPPKAEEMYSPETFGRGATDRVIVE